MKTEAVVIGTFAPLIHVRHRYFIPFICRRTTVVFYVLQFPAIVFSWSVIFRSCKFSVPSYDTLSQMGFHEPREEEIWGFELRTPPKTGNYFNARFTRWQQRSAIPPFTKLFRCFLDIVSFVEVDSLLCTDMHTVGLHNQSEITYICMCRCVIPRNQSNSLVLL